MLFFLISIHAPLRERRPAHLPAHYQSVQFQSTLPCGSDLLLPLFFYLLNDFNPRSLAGATYFSHVFHLLFNISIHAPLRERPACPIWQGFAAGFQSTLPCGSDRQAVGDGCVLCISIHAPLRERLQAYWLRIMTDDNFNPRSLAGATKVKRW